MKKLLYALTCTMFFAAGTIAQDVLTVTDLTAATSGAQGSAVDSVPVGSTHFILINVSNGMGNDVPMDDSLVFRWTIGGNAQPDRSAILQSGLQQAGTTWIALIDDFTGSTVATEEHCIVNTYNFSGSTPSPDPSEEHCENVIVHDTGSTGGTGINALINADASLNAFYSYGKVFVVAKGVSSSTEVDVQIMDLTGQVVMERSTTFNGQSTDSKYFEFGDQPDGVYIVNMSTQGVLTSQKFVKY